MSCLKQVYILCNPPKSTEDILRKFKFFSFRALNFSRNLRTSTRVGEAMTLKKKNVITLINNLSTDKRGKNKFLVLISPGFTKRRADDIEIRDLWLCLPIYL